MREIQVDSIQLERLAPLLTPERAARLAERAAQAREMLDGITVWNVSATATGGGVAEMLQSLLAYARGVPVDTRWLVLNGSPEFFRLTKRLHNHLHGAPGDGGPVNDSQRELYERILADNLARLTSRVRRGDIVLLHDPQTAGLVEGLMEAGAHVVWRCHVGRDTPNDLTDGAWEFLRPYIEPAPASIFSRQAYAPYWIAPDRLWLIPPSLDPFSAKNYDMTRNDVEAALRQANLVHFPSDHGDLTFVRRDGSTGTVRPHTDLLFGTEPVPPEARVVLQVSRWDRLKDMSGVLAGFAAYLSRLPEDVHLMLVGPDVSGVSDDPEGAEVLEECMALWRALSEQARSRLHLCSLPMDDTDENAHLVNALQRHAAVVVQKSLVEGFGLTVTEPMWKARPVIASRVGGIQDQIEHGTSGLLLDDPHDLDGFGKLLVDVLTDDEVARSLGTAARERVRDTYLGDRHLIQYADLFRTLLAAPRA
jgi:trehalose synthase